MFKLLELWKLLKVKLMADEEGGGAVAEEAPPAGGMAEVEEAPPAEDGGEEAPPAESEESEGGEPDTKEDKTPKWMKKEIYAERERRRIAEEKLEAYKAGINDGKSPLQQKEPELVEPNPDDFETTNEYLKAALAHDRELLRRENKKEIQNIRNEVKQETAQSQVVSDWKTLEAKAAAEKNDYMEVVEEFKSQVNDQYGQPVLAAVLYSKNPDVAYHLGQNPSEIHRLKSLGNPMLIAQEIGKMAAKLESNTPLPASKPKPKPVVKPKGGQGGGGDNTPKEEDSAKEWIRKRELQLKTKRGL